MVNEAKFREDSDLAFLQYLDYKDLQLLADTLIKDVEGKSLLKSKQVFISKTP